jgi:hypothetical protein
MNVVGKHDRVFGLVVVLDPHKKHIFLIFKGIVCVLKELYLKKKSHHISDPYTQAA